MEEGAKEIKEAKDVEEAKEAEEVQVCWAREWFFNKVGSGLRKFP